MIPYRNLLPIDNSFKRHTSFSRLRSLVFTLLGFSFLTVAQNPIKCKCFFKFFTFKTNTLYLTYNQSFSINLTSIKIYDPDMILKHKKTKDSTYTKLSHHQSLMIIRRRLRNGRFFTIYK